MTDVMLETLLIVAAIGAGLMAGVYFAFSTFIMRALDQLGAVVAADVMNAMNKVILRTWFMFLFFGSTSLYALLSINALSDVDLSGRWLLFSTGVIYVFGMFLCTALFNVPLNNRLAGVNRDESAKAKMWTLYLTQWTRWNHIRTVCSLLTLMLSLKFLLTYT